MATKPPTKRQAVREANMAAWRASIRKSALELYGSLGEADLRIRLEWAMRILDGSRGDGSPMDAADAQIKADVCSELLAICYDPSP